MQWLNVMCDLFDWFVETNTYGYATTRTPLSGLPAYCLSIVKMLTSTSLKSTHHVNMSKLIAMYNNNNQSKAWCEWFADTHIMSSHTHTWLS